MIVIKHRKDCCGCSACVQKCPKQCISMQFDDEGFYYPVVQKDLCVNCGLCEKVCPVINQEEPRLPLSCIAATGKNDNIVRKSSSAGLFYLLAEYTIKNGGVVFGAKFNDNWDVVHHYVDNLYALDSLLGSKYVQSDIGNSYKMAEIFLKDGREVLFSGTPCQISGLKHYLHKEYEKLVCVDVVCHGSPSPGVWREYLKYIMSPAGRKNTVSSCIYTPISDGDALRIKGISFRDKRISWKKFSFVLLSSQGGSRSEENSVSSSYMKKVCQKHYFNDYMRSFLYNFTLRYSCFSCPARKGRSGSDILLGDYWGITRSHPEFFNENGVSMALAYTTKGSLLLRALDINSIPITYDDALSNTNIEYDESMPDERTVFFTDFRRDRIKSMKAYCKKKSPSIIFIAFKSLIYRIKRIFK